MVARRLADEASGLNKPEATVANTTMIPVAMGMLISGCRMAPAVMCAMWQIAADNATAVMP
jgi:ABC-type proline/glycine betaine transport system permease subunit